jgi:tripartite-type tricarboxylate transporter receptor subunit TctC
MKIIRRRFLHLAAGAAVLPTLPRIARAQTYPTRPITMVVGAAAGGPTDTIGRIITQRMRASLGQPIVTENNGAASRMAGSRMGRQMATPSASATGGRTSSTVRCTSSNTMC